MLNLTLKTFVLRYFEVDLSTLRAYIELLKGQPKERAAKRLFINTYIPTMTKRDPRRFATTPPTAIFVLNIIVLKIPESRFRKTILKMIVFKTSRYHPANLKFVQTLD